MKKTAKARKGRGKMCGVGTYSVWISVEMHARGALGEHAVRQQGQALASGKISLGAAYSRRRSSDFKIGSLL